MPDTPENLEAFPQHKNQKARVGFPLARILIMICAVTGIETRIKICG